MRVATYARTATDTDDGTLSIAHQRRQLRDYIADHHYELVAEFCDTGGRGVTAPGVRQAVCDAQVARFDTLVVTHPDRLARPITTLREAVDALAATGITVRSLSSPLPLTSSEAISRLRIAAAMTEVQSDHAARHSRERTRTRSARRLASDR